jgi:hypothetical protein
MHFGVVYSRVHCFIKFSKQKLEFTFIIGGENFSRKGSLKKGRGGGNKCPKNEELRRHFNIL